ncbi:MAG: DUF4924 family protein [Flavobacteriales bacterium]|nr:DUF4924 family protein [Flavobacteriales bacterium]MCB9193689.1 DUF4924 family protein [Flavobacteriales bacterium]
MDLFEEERSDNIASYVVRMWHVEDLMRAHDLRFEKVRELLVDDLPGGADQRAAAMAWYRSVIDRMKQEGLEKQGHLTEVTEAIHDLETLHKALIEVVKDADYIRLFEAAVPGILALEEHAPREDDRGPIETCFTGIYGVMLLRAQGRKLSEGTVEADQHIRRLLGALSEHYRNMRKLPGVSLN